MDRRRKEDESKGAVPRKLFQPLSDLIRERRLAAKQSEKKMEDPIVEDPYKATYDFKNKFKKQTAYVYCPGIEHYSPWDKSHPENPLRATAIHEALTPMLPRMHKVVYDEEITLDEESLLCYGHPVEYQRLIKNLGKRADPRDAQMYDSIYYHEDFTLRCAAQTVRSVVSMAKLVAEGEYQNGFANVRPPGHHATKDVPNGFCIFNNVAITAKYLLRHKLAERVLIVDYDVHHGQGIQQMFYNTNKVLYFSIHRYEHGTYWPNLKESNFDHIGEADGLGYNVNVPLNETGLNDRDYLAIIINVLLPMAYEFNPSIILIASGYDASLGDPEGRMKVTPAFYGHVITLLSGLAQGKIVAILEGGYFIPGLVESALQTVRALLNDPCNPLEYAKHINPSVRDSINDVKGVLRPYWKCFNQLDAAVTVSDIHRYDKFGFHVSIRKYIGEVEKPPFPLHSCHPLNKPREEALFLAQLELFKEDKYNNTQTKVGYMLNHESINHQPPPEQRVQEVHMRVIDIMMKLKDFDLRHQMVNVDFEHSREDYIHPTIWEDMWDAMLTTHSSSYIYELGAKKEDSRSDLYWTDKSRTTCQWSISILCQLAIKIREMVISYGVGIIRPPGHHAKTNEGGGFCLINNVVVAANYLIRKKMYQKILIVDFDVHHGDGTQEMTYTRNDIMYISMHRFDDGKFFPKDRTGNYTYVGDGKGVGYNVNIPFNTDKMENADYIFTWIKIVLPLCYAFHPDLIFVSAGFDATINDPLGNYNVYPETFGHLVQLLKPVAPLILALEGGYNYEATSLGLINCVRSLLGHPLPMPIIGDVKESTMKTITNVVTTLKPYWPVMEVNKLVELKEKKEDTIEVVFRATRALTFDN